MDEGGEVMDKQEQERLRDIASDIRGMYAALLVIKENSEKTVTLLEQLLAKIPDGLPREHS
jgi:hypothetical protein